MFWIQFFQQTLRDASFAVHDSGIDLIACCQQNHSEFVCAKLGVEFSCQVDGMAFVAE
jgi:hypothetical protein